MALFTDHSYSDERFYKMASVLDDHISWLGWYQILVVSTKPQEKVLDVLAFSPFPLNSSTLSKQLNADGTRWRLPREARIDSTRLPKLILDHLTVAIDKRDYSLGLSSRTPAAKWIMALTEFETASYRNFGIEPKDSTTLNIAIEVRAKPDEHKQKENDPEIVLRIINKDKFIHPIAEDLENRLHVVKQKLSDMCGRADDLLGRKPGDQLRVQVENRLKGVTLKSSPDDGWSSQVAEHITVLLTALKEGVSLERDDKKKIEMSMLIADLESPRMLMEQIQKYYILNRAISNAAIRSAKIFYELEDTLTKKSYPVDIVNFDDRDAAPAKKDGN